jgi:hypothetical protein
MVNKVNISAANYIGKLVCCLIVLMLLSNLAMAHTINYNLEGAPAGHVILFYISLGFQHILPNGFDHILFILGLFLMNTKLKPVLWQATCFTVAHSVTLILSAKGIIIVPPAITEPLIALTIFFIAIENLFFKKVKPWRYALIFLFGLIHGMGFATALNEIGLPQSTFYTALISFNIGVEFGQIAVIMMAWFIIGKWYAHETWYRARMVYPLSIMIALTAVYWTIDRVFNL